MSSSALRIIAVLLALGALVLGYMGYQASHAPVINESKPITEKPAPEPVRLPVLVAAQAIETGSTLSEDDVTTIFVEKQPEDSYSAQRQVLGRQTRMPVAAGDLILKDHFHDFSHLVTAIRPGERAIAIRVDEVTGVGGFVQPGDFVDVFLFLDAGQEVGGDSSAQRVLSAARVLAYGNTVEQTDVEAIQQKAQLNVDNNQTEANADTQNTDGNEEAASKEQDEPTGKQSKTAVLAVTEKQVSELLLAESTGRLRLALLGPDALAAKVDDEAKPTEAEKAEAEKQMRQVVTLEKFKPETTETAKARPASTQRTTQPAPPPPQPKVTVHRGVDAATISVDREN